MPQLQLCRCRMLLWEYLWWTDISIPVEPINWETSPEERRREMREIMLKVLQGVHDKDAGRSQGSTSQWLAMPSANCHARALRLEICDFERAFPSAQKACNLQHKVGGGCAAVSDHKAAVMWAERANALLLACDNLFALNGVREAAEAGLASSSPIFMQQR